MPVLTIVVLAVIVASIVAFAAWLAWAHAIIKDELNAIKAEHARPANSLPAAIGNASRPRRRPF